MKNYWLRLPDWSRKVIVAGVETGAVAFIVYFGNVVEGTQSWSINAAALIVIKAMVQTVRVHPALPIKDYVNAQPPQIDK